MPKKLFALRDTSNKRLVPGQFFSDKTAAKNERARLNPKDDEGKEVMNYVVTYGPDHRKFNQ